ncbi:hypothetical protein I5W35_06775 [Stenotrophomonas maltophilia]|nr:hypothetical protein [Stenotrophomonas maltophilia]
MKFCTNKIPRPKPANPFCNAHDDQGDVSSLSSGPDASAKAPHLSHLSMEQRLSARHVWQFLDEGRSTFYARQNPKDPSYDPLFPRPIPSSTKGTGPRRWKLGAIVAWLQLCESNAASA